MALISEQWPFLLEPGLRVIFEQTRAPLIAESVLPKLFNMQSSSKAAEHDRSIGGMGDWTEYDGRIEYDSTAPGFPTDYVHVEYTKGIAIERKLVDDDQYNIINSRVRMLALTAQRTREKHGAAVFTNAFSSANLGGDGKALVATDHPLKPGAATPSHSNKGTSALTYDSIIATRALMRKFVDDTNNLVPINPTVLLVPPGLEETAYYATQAMNKAESPSGGFPNYVRSKGFQVVVWDYLEDTNDWFMIDPSLAGIYLNWFDRVPLEFAVDPTGDYHLMARYRGYMRYTYGWSDWRWIFGHQVA